MADLVPPDQSLATGETLGFVESAPLLEITGLRTDIALKRSTVHAVDGVDLEVGAGECLGLVGESGCGKTITALSVLQLLPTGGHVVDGSVRLEGVELLGLQVREMQAIRGGRVGMVFQDPLTSLNPTITVGNQIAEAVLLHRDVSRKEARRRALEVLDLVGIAQARSRLDDFPHQFSGGMRQRVMIAIALACDPRLLIADEPTTALDVTIQAQILELIDRLRRDLEMAVVLVTHDLGVVAGRADRVAVMYAGKIVETAEALELFAHPRHRYTQALFDALPERATERREQLASIPGLPPDLSTELTGCRFAPRCSFAQDDCRASSPPFLGPAGGHRHACLHPVADEELARTRVTRPEGEAGARSDEVLLAVEHLVKDFPLSHHVLGRTRYRVSAVAGVSLEVRRGETYGLVGESGSGKTTLGRLIVGLDEPTSGVVRLEGKDVSRLSSRERRAVRRRVQFMFQDPYASLDPRMRVGQVLREPLAIQRIGSREEQRSRVEEALESVGLPRSAADRFPHEFSGGQRQRLGLARALILRPELVVADEPVSALDVSIQAQILNTLRELQDRLDLTYLVISHDLSVIRYLSDRIGVMYLGKLVEDGPSEEVYHHPLHPYTHGLIATVPEADPQLERAKKATPLEGELPSAVEPPSGCRFRTRCPLAQQVCADEEPPLVALRPGHRAACHFPLENVAPSES
ncbi:ABC transporter ATP-binding protein [Nocardioides panaciterrulae]|uniref:Peptide/nickel transport system ATP-binding protein n=1 Tax=Nocardioides panaciterrulae TaxID=661492 RepID=A0A7Y9JAN7_9ACTN|nr:ABC transporter ATP-binding protein [Nocardioides panaciterrulae]NYD41902.1 peptide/nickel transport system ATP-binding protein [Nocardioides panaciterrulae]